MNTLVCAVIFGVLATAIAEPPRYRNPRFQFQRQELAPSAEADVEPTTPSQDVAPYAAAGFRPPKEFKLPVRQEFAPPGASYGAPADSYGAPLHTFTETQKQYGIPEPRQRKDGNVNEKPNEGEVVEQKSEVERVQGGETKGRLREREETEDRDSDAEVISSQGAYYVLLPNAQVQRVQFTTQNDLRNMAYTARLQYRAEDRAPVYLYPAAAISPAAPYIQRAAYIQLV